MVVIRPVTPGDLDALLALATQSGFGLTTLPKDRELLAKRVARSQRAFAESADQPSGECYLFVMEDLATRAVVGTCGVCSKVGGFEPFYAFRVTTQTHESSFLGVRKEHRFLELVSEHNGPCEIGSLFLAPDYRRDGNGRLLSLSRFVFMAEWANAFDPMVIAEMRGVIDERGGSPFWEAVGRNFFGIEFARADYLSMVNKKFIAELMPKHPICASLLSAAAQQVIGQVHEQTRPALRMLEEEGFRHNGMVDVFEGGPVVTCPIGDIRTVRQSRRATVAAVGEVAAGGVDFIVGTTRKEYRACKSAIEEAGPASVRIPPECAAALQVKAGDTVRYSLMRTGARK